MLRVGAFIFHTTAAAVMTWGWRSLNKLESHELVRKQRGGHLLYLTTQGLAIAWICMILSMIRDLRVFKFGSEFKFILDYINRVLLMIALPQTVSITVFYCLVTRFFPAALSSEAPAKANTSSDPEARADSGEETPLLSPPSAHSTEVARIPVLTDLALRLAPLLALLIDFFVFERRYTPGMVRIVAPIAIAVYGLGYIGLVELCARRNGVFPYPFLTKNRLGVRLLIYVAIARLVWDAFRLLNMMHV
ncbi:hypothetical protein HYDPIDRAFT_119669 [Hydnomerulius pinastri MD-312]|uniref:Uncharacterized protein n=1 Tax=Hydnomerulius pinastri MD-312 TaxID=994086 RepID=A0A0C9W7D7_9AGAM|nr:hypothetical protein HYDPIDRAFT_119669 [Hydnomerulius pinastri MD-312]